MEDRFSLAALPRGHQYLRRLQARLVSDVVIDLKCGRVAALVVPVPCRLFGLLGRRDDYVIPWEQVRRVGADVFSLSPSWIRPAVPAGRRNFSEKSEKSDQFFAKTLEN